MKRDQARAFLTAHAGATIAHYTQQQSVEAVVWLLRREHGDAPNPGQVRQFLAAQGVPLRTAALIRDEATWRQTEALRLRERGLTLTAIGAQLGISRERVRQLVSKARTQPQA